MVILFCTVIALFAAVNGIHLFRQTQSVQPLSSQKRCTADSLSLAVNSVGSILLLNLPAYKFVASLARGVGGRQARVGRLSLLPSGTSLLVVGLVVFSAGKPFSLATYASGRSH